MVYFILWLGIVLYIITEVAVCRMKTVTLEVIQSSDTGPACPGQEIILTCTVEQKGAVQELYLNWKQESVTSPTSKYDSNNPSTVGPQTLGDFITTAVFMTSTTSTVSSLQCYIKSAALTIINISYLLL